VPRSGRSPRCERKHGGIFATMKRKDQAAIVTDAGRKFGEKLATIYAL
jgi:hypothetical protein